MTHHVARARTAATGAQARSPKLPPAAVPPARAPPSRAVDPPAAEVVAAQQPPQRDAGRQAQRHRPGRDPERQRQRLHLDGLQTSLTLLADQTGGRAILDTNDVGAPLARALDESRPQYRLAVRPRHARVISALTMI